MTLNRIYAIFLLLLYKSFKAAARLGPKTLVAPSLGARDKGPVSYDLL